MDLNLEKVVLVSGTFNLIHPGHIHFLEKAKLLGDRLVVFLDVDERNKDLKGQKAIFSFEERKKILESIFFIDEIYPYDGPDDAFVGHLQVERYRTIHRPLRCARNLIFAKGSDYSIKTLDQEQLKILKSFDASVVFIELLEGYSTSKLCDEIVRRKLTEVHYNLPYIPPGGVSE